MVVIKSIEPVENHIVPNAFTLEITVKLLDEISDYIQFYLIKPFDEENFIYTDFGQYAEELPEKFLKTPRLRKIVKDLLSRFGVSLSEENHLYKKLHRNENRCGDAEYIQTFAFAIKMLESIKLESDRIL